MVESDAPEKYDEKNIFMKIIRGEATAHRVYEDEDTIAIMDVMPHCTGHVLVLPKAPARNIFDATQDTLCKVIPVVQKIAIACKKALQADGIKIMQFNEVSASQTVFHLHFHIIPCKGECGNDFHHKKTKVEDFQTLELTAKKIRKELEIS
ncbi:HIT family protein [Candidatus Liberibacter sp.]|uniref:HIT family protein n=1 Tax=Candidatus Liberibacter sp. TaxID=34022 RepID=UPI0015F5F31B|nr:HIT domain-containing protein [Candidatus Liberibacter sp.]MBA5724555.1 HIT domain-containing protein [Candidatus Liberibacter sp.]